MKKYGLFEDENKDLLYELQKKLQDPYYGDPIREQIDKDYKKSIKIMNEEFARKKELDKKIKRDLDKKLRFDCDRAGIPTLLED